MVKQKIILLVSALSLLLVGFILALSLGKGGNDRGLEALELAANPPVTYTKTPVVESTVELVPPYVPEKNIEPTPPPIPEGAKLNSRFVLAPTKPAESVTDPITGQMTKIININVNENISPDKIYLSKGDLVSLKINNQQLSTLTLVSNDKTRMSDMEIAPGESKTVVYDTLKTSDLFLICQTCVPPKPLNIKILVGGAPK